MTTRAIKKLTKKDDIKMWQQQLTREQKDNDEAASSDNNDDDDDDTEQSVVPKNKFDLLNDLDADIANDSDTSNNDDKNENEDASVIAKEKEAKKATSKKKKKSNKKKVETTDGGSGEFKFVSADITNLNLNDEDNDNAPAAGASAASSSLTPTVYTEQVRRLIQIDTRHLNADNEMIRMFGARIVNAERQSAALANSGGARANRRGANATGGGSKLSLKQNCIVTKKASWPLFNKNGLSMKLVPKEETENSNNSNVVDFAFEHDKAYQRSQFAFLDAVDSLDHNNIIGVLHMNAYHIDSLIQLSDVSRMQDDTQMAADLIERALYTIQNSLHPSFSLAGSKASPGASTAGAMYRLDYRRQENRCFFIALFKHILYVGGKACYRTALELCKLLLSLDVEADPLGCILLVDFYAIRASQYQYLVELYEALEASKHLHLMPNMAMSVALAHHYLYRETGSDASLQAANRLLRDALVRFPALLMELLDRCGVQADKQVEASRLFSKVSHLNTPQGLKYLIDLYVSRMHYEWKIAENVQWLEQTVQDMIQREKSLESLVNAHKKKCKTLFAKIPPNLYRHLILSDLKEVAAHLPPDYASTALYTFDPIPPKNSIVSYTRPQITASQQSTINMSRAESLLTFFQSLLPNFNAQDINRAAGEGARAEGEEDEAEAGNANEANHLFDMNQMVARLRDFLTRVEENAPAQQPDENGAAAADEHDHDDNLGQYD